MVRSRLIILINEEINEANWMVSNSAKLDRRTKQHTQFGVSASNGSRDMARTKSWWKKKKKNNEANWMVSDSAKLDRRTKQHTQFGVSASNGSRDMARTKSWREKKIINKREQTHIASPTGIANKQTHLRREVTCWWTVRELVRSRLVPTSPRESVAMLRG